MMKMLRASVGLILVSIPPVLFVAYCRSLLAQASETTLSAAGQEAIAAESEAISAKDFRGLHALARLCPFVQKHEASPRAMSVYYFLLQGLSGICSQMCDAFARWTERERQKCSYFVVVRIDRRVASARALLAEQTSDSEKQSLPPSSRPF
ncbi:MAG: hypothetical protein ACRD4X_12380 [Candidatus Acidiferrales bacterium]